MKAPATAGTARELGRLVGVDVADASSRVNRHGIPLFGDPPKKCLWPQCPYQTVAGLGERLPLCYDHAYRVWHAIDADNKKLQAIIDRRVAREQEARQSSKSASPASEDVVYYLQIGGHIKIGWTSNLDQRMRSYPPNTILLAVHPGSRADEKALHKRFAVHRSHGQEWYPLVPVLLDHIKRVVAEQGEPPATAFGAKPVKVPTPHRQRPQLAAKYGPMLRG